MYMNKYIFICFGLKSVNPLHSSRKCCTFVASKEKEHYSTYKALSIMADKKFNDNGHEYVDLELPSGTLWATCNVGASKFTDYGLYFQWGDTKGYTPDQIGEDKEQKEFIWTDYKWYNKSTHSFDNSLVKYATLKLENESLKKQADTLNSKNFDPDSYEQVLLEQFETMKSAFIKKIDDMTEELSQLKSDSRTKIYSLEQELKESQHLKDVFLQQIVQLQKQLNI